MWRCILGTLGFSGIAIGIVLTAHSTHVQDVYELTHEAERCGQYAAAHHLNQQLACIDIDEELYHAANSWF